MDTPKIVAFDVETTNFQAPFGRAMAVVCKDILGRETKIFREDDPLYATGQRSDDSKLIEAVRDYMESAWMWISWYGKMFDIPFLNGRLLLNGLRPIEKRLHLDLIYFSRAQFIKLGSSKLDNVAKRFRLKNQKTPLDADDWVHAGYDGDKEALDRVVKHCVYDVRVLVETFQYLAPFVANIHK